MLKESRFRLKIDTHDYETKRGHALRFLGAGDKVKAMIQFRGREQQRPEMGIRLLQRFADDVADVGVVESSPRIDGRNMVLVVGPLKNKAEAKAEARRASQRAEAKAQNEAKATGGGRVDVSGDDQAPLTQSLADLLPEGFAITTVPETEAPAEAETPVAPVEAAPESEAPVKEAPVKEAPAEEVPVKEAAPKAAPVKEAAVQEAPKQAAPKAAAPKREAPKAAPAPVKAPAAVKPAEAAPAAPRPPVPMPKPIARPAAPKPAARPAPKAAPKPAGKKTT